MTETLLEARGLAKSFGGVAALAGVDVALRRGEVLGLIGPNGSGKTTFFNLVSGLLRPTRGTIRFADADLTRLRPHAICALGVARTFQTSRLWPNMTALENVLLGMHSRLRAGVLGALVRGPAVTAEERAAERGAVELLGLFPEQLLPAMNALAGSLSYANRRRLEIARALAAAPSLLLLDEPAAGMDPRESAALVGDLQRIRRARPIAMCVIEHDMTFMEDLAERVIVFDHGEKISEGTFDEVRQDTRVVEAYLGRRRERADAEAR